MLEHVYQKGNARPHKLAISHPRGDCEVSAASASKLDSIMDYAVQQSDKINFA